jgi:hypothetical protein
MGSGHFRSRADIESFFGDCELVEPGLVSPSDWWPDGPRKNRSAGPNAC